MDNILTRLDKVQQIPQEYLVETPPVPKSVKIELSTACNYKCSFCSHGMKSDKSGKEMDWGLFVKITTEMKQLGVEEVGPFLIGEPFLNPELTLRAITFLKQELKFPYVFLTTNGSRATPESVEALMKAGLDSLKWSINTGSWEQFETITGVPAKFFILAKRNILSAWNIREVNKYNTKLYASSIVYDEKQQERMREFLDKHVRPYVDKHYWLPLYSMGGKVKQVLDYGKKKAPEPYKPTAGNSGQYDNPVEPIPCWTLFTAAHIMCDGRMTACCTDGEGTWEVGDLKKQTFMECWHSEEFKKLRKAHLENNIVGTKCEQCALLPKDK